MDRSDWLAIVAIFLSSLAVFVSIYEARILKDQQEIMQAQQKASIWPYLRTSLSYEYSDKLRVKLSVENKGLGPALIQDSRIFINKKARDSYMEIDSSFRAILPDTVDIGLSMSGIGGAILSPGEKVLVLELQCNRFEGDNRKIYTMLLEHRLCFCSLYDDCWTVSSLAPRLSSVDQCEGQKFQSN